MLYHHIPFRNYKVKACKMVTGLSVAHGAIEIGISSASHDCSIFFFLTSYSLREASVLTYYVNVETVLQRNVS